MNEDISEPMDEGDEFPEILRDLIDDYLTGAADEARIRALQTHLLGNERARHYFVRYCRLHTELELDARAREAGDRALQTIVAIERDGTPIPAAPPGRTPSWGLAAAAAALLLAVGWSIYWTAMRPAPQPSQPREEIAWLVNAQNCQWAENLAPAGDMQEGKVLQLERGLAEIRFQKGARVVMEGPAALALLSGNSVRLLRGKLTAKVPDAAKGFQVVTPKGKVVDLGTEFALAVEEDGTTDVYVFAGKVEAHANAAPSAPAGFLSLEEKQGARIDIRGVSLMPAQPAPEAKPFVRDIPVIVPRSFELDFRAAIAGTLLDRHGQGTGLAHRLPGTGRRFKLKDDNLRLNPADGQLELTTTNSDLNTQYRLEQGEYLGIRLADFGFTGPEDFALTVVVPSIPALQKVGQFGLYAGTRSDHSIRGGLLSSKEPEQYRQFLVQNQAGKDAPPHYVGLTTPGDDLRLTLRREGKNFALTVENLTTGNASALTMPQPAYLEGQRDLYVGFFGANTQSEVRRTLLLKEFKATVWTLAP